MAGRVLSIEIGYSLTRVCELDYKAKTPKVYKSFTVPTLDGVVNDGVLQLDTHYLEGLRGGMREQNIKAKQVIFSISSGKIANREVTIPFVKENRIGDVVRAKAPEYFPMELSQYELAYTILETLGEEKGNKQYKLMVLAVPAALLKGYYDLAAALRLDVAAIDYAGNSLFQIVKKECTTGTHLIAKIDERSTLIMVIQDQKIAFTRNVAYGVDEALQVVGDSAAWGTVRNIRQAIQIVEQNSCIELDAGSAERAPEMLSREDTARRHVTEALAPMVGGIVRVIDYYISRNPAVIDMVHITGVGANFLGMNDLLQKEIDYPVSIIKKVEGLNLEKYFKEGFLGEYLSCIGAVMAPVNFKLHEDKSKAKGKSAGKGSASSGDSVSRGWTILAWTLFAAGFLSAAGMTAISIVNYLEAEKKNADLKRQVEELKPIVDVYNTYIDVKAEYNKVKAMYEVTESRNDELYEFMLELEQKLPSDVNVVTFTSDRSQVTMTMNVSTKGEAAATIEQLRTLESLLPESITVTAVTEEVDEENNSITVNFTVAALYAPVNHEEEAAEEAEGEDTAEGVENSETVQ